MFQLSYPRLSLEYLLLIWYEKQFDSFLVFALLYTSYDVNYILFFCKGTLHNIIRLKYWSTLNKFDSIKSDLPGTKHIVSTQGKKRKRSLNCISSLFCKYHARFRALLNKHWRKISREQINLLQSRWTKFNLIASNTAIKLFYIT